MISIDNFRLWVLTSIQYSSKTSNRSNFEPQVKKTSYAANSLWTKCFKNLKNRNKINITNNHFDDTLTLLSWGLWGTPHWPWTPWAPAWAWTAWRPPSGFRSEEITNSYLNSASLSFLIFTFCLNFKPRSCHNSCLFVYTSKVGLLRMRLEVHFTDPTWRAPLYLKHFRCSNMVTSD